ncbi:Peptidase S54, rhomboid domain [Dillenia turbinata]|uniref:RHOMBOID-like protein n=1 Tax=Dillenia turbinata TaxID=194707 RepID=A0AAN8UDW1_9MAGN
MGRRPGYDAEAYGGSRTPPGKMYMPAPMPWFPWLVPLFVIANVAMFCIEMYVNDCPSRLDPDDCLFYSTLGRLSFQPFNENRLLGPSEVTLIELGALQRDAVLKHGEEWRLLSCIWLHGGAIHLLANMLSLMLVGVRHEQEFGFHRIGPLYVLSGLSGSLLSCLHLDVTKTSVGASGALFGLLGAMLSELITNWSIYANKCAAMMSLILISGLNLAVGFLPGVDSYAHIGGFVSGFLLGFILLMRPQYGYVNPKYISPGYSVKKKSKYNCFQYFFLATATIIFLLGNMIGWIMLFKGGDNSI